VGEGDILQHADSTDNLASILIVNHSCNYLETEPENIPKRFVTGPVDIYTINLMGCLLAEHAIMAFRPIQLLEILRKAEMKVVFLSRDEVKSLFYRRAFPKHAIISEK
jgi:hypothetical protein